MNETIPMPSLGFGCYGRRGAEGIAAIRTALEMGYRHLDTAQDYQTEAEVGQAIRASGIARSAVYVTTKVATGNLGAGRVIPSLEESRRTLGLDQIELALIHWPSPNGALPPESYLEQLKAAQEAGICRDIGVSNFTIALINQAEALLGPGELTCNQIELNPLFKNPKIATHCQSRGIRITCYLPIARGLLSGNPTIAGIAKTHGVTGEQIGLAWEWAKGYAAIPTSSRPDRIAAGFAAQAIRLTPDEIAAIDAIPDAPRVIAPDWGPAWD
jgi:2,5-diketo-D-gluconate reductase B